MKKMASTIGVTLSIFFLLILAVVSFSILREGITSLKKVTDAKKWPTAKGVLQEVQLIEISKYRAGTKVNVKYSYDVEGITYEGSEISLGAIGHSREQNYKIYSKLKSAKQIEVRFNPADYRQSTLTYGVTTPHLVHITLGAIFVIVALGMAILIMLPLFSDAELSKSLAVLE